MHARLTCGTEADCSKLSSGPVGLEESDNYGNDQTLQWS